MFIGKRQRNVKFMEFVLIITVDGHQSFILVSEMCERLLVCMQGNGEGIEKEGH